MHICVSICCHFYSTSVIFLSFFVIILKTFCHFFVIFYKAPTCHPVLYSALLKVFFQELCKMDVLCCMSDFEIICVLRLFFVLDPLYDIRSFEFENLRHFSRILTFTRGVAGGGRGGVHGGASSTSSSLNEVRYHRP